MSVIEASSAYDFIVSTLKADSSWSSLSPGGVRRGAAPVGASYPITIVQFVSGVDILTANATRMMVDAVYLIKAIGLLTDTANVFALAAEIDVALGGDTGLRHIDVTGGHILNCHRQSTIQYDDTDNTGTQYTHLGGLYRIRNQQK